MDDIDEIINEARDAREVKRAVSVKMSAQGFSPVQISQVLNVSLQYVSKWKGLYEAGGGVVLRLGHRGSESYLGEEERQAILRWIGARETVSVEALGFARKLFAGLILSGKRDCEHSALHAGRTGS